MKEVRSVKSQKQRITLLIKKAKNEDSQEVIKQTYWKFGAWQRCDYIPGVHRKLCGVSKRVSQRG